VRFDCLTPIRDWGFTSNILAPDVVEPRFARELPVSEWIRLRIDTARGIATPETHAGALGAFTVPLEPMVGCFGVAPAGGQAISTATSGPHGGNMDYRGFRQGVTVYLPVSVPGIFFRETAMPGTVRSRAPAGRLRDAVHGKGGQGEAD
jgi:acetamidase/formamidase